MVRPTLWVLVLVGCGTSTGGRDKGPTSSSTSDSATDLPSTGSGTGTTSGAPTDTGTTTSTAVLETRGVQTCADPAPRASNHFFLKRGAAQPIDTENIAGGGLAIADFDGDGLKDMFIPSERSVQLWLASGNPDDQFEEVVGTRGWLTDLDLAGAVGAVAVDVDGDVDLDLLVTRFDAPAMLLRNDGQGRFEDITAGAGLHPGALSTQSASFADIDRDGDLDLFVGTYGADPDRIDACDQMVPDPSQLYRNRGDGTFEDVSHLLPEAVQRGYVFMSGWFDIDGDGYPELFTSHDAGNCAGSVLVDNIDGERFVVDEASGWHPGHHDMGMAVGDLNGDEQPDFLLTSFEGVALAQSLPSATALNGVQWIDFTDARGLHVDHDKIYGWGAELGDLDNDGDEDAVVLHGYWETWDRGAQPRDQPDYLYVQEEDGTFTNRASDPLWRLDSPKPGRGVVLADLNEDGYLDVVKRYLNDATYLFQSNCGTDGWVRVQLRGPAPNTRGIGARIRVTTTDRTQVRWITAGSTGMYSGSPPEAHFGLGPASAIDRLEVVWPDLSVSTFEDIEPNQVLTIHRSE